MAAKFPVRRGQTDSASFMAHGFDPDLAEWSPFHGAVYAVLLSVTRLVAMGADWRRAYLTLQEYFEKLTDRTSWENLLLLFLVHSICRRLLVSVPSGAKTP